MQQTAASACQKVVGTSKVVVSGIGGVLQGSEESVPTGFTGFVDDFSRYGQSTLLVVPARRRLAVAPGTWANLVLGTQQYAPQQIGGLRAVCWRSAWSYILFHFR